MWDLILLVPDHCLSFYFSLADVWFYVTGSVCLSCKIVQLERSACEKVH